jgi:gliding motility-associated lipoprotein GldH
MKFPLKRTGAFLSILIMLAVVAASCRQLDIFEKNTNIPGMKWQNNFTATGTFNITDTASLYNIYIVLRHTDGYKYNNIWLNAGIQAPGDSMQLQKINLTLANDATGWEGTGMNDIWEVRKLISAEPKPFFRKAGIYTFSISQIMRDNPLENVMSAGMRIEKVSQ